MPEPLVSVVIPTYNREQFLPLSIGSVLAQTYGNWELILVDDGSTDGTADLVESYMERDPRIRFLANGRSKGPSGARNQGFDVARGEYVALLDSDDEWFDFHLERAIYYLSKYPEQIDLVTANPLRKKRATGDVYREDELDLTQYDYERLEDAYLFDSDTLFDCSLRRRIITTQTLVCKKSVVDEVRFDEELLAATDVLFPREIAYRRTRVAHLQEYHCTYWAHDKNITNCGGNQSIEKRLQTRLQFEKCQMKYFEKFELTADQTEHVTKALADLRFWRIAYAGYLQLDDLPRARSYFWKALRDRPTHVPYWKTFLIRGVLGLRGRSALDEPQA